jgi:hypothetical protein
MTTQSFPSDADDTGPDNNTRGPEIAATPEPGEMNPGRDVDDEPTTTNGGATNGDGGGHEEQEQSF